MVSKKQKNVLGDDIELCCNKPKTGFFRDGFCHTSNQDIGTHVVCVYITDEFLAYSKSVGNDLTSPNPEINFPGLSEGDKWCICIMRWKQALENNVAPPVCLEATNYKALDYVTLDQLRQNSVH